jgi:hypothetical protein
VEAILAEALIQHVICNRREETLSTGMYSARLTRRNGKIKDTKDHARLS